MERWVLRSHCQYRAVPIGAAGLMELPVGAAAAIVLLVLRPGMSRREIGWAAALGGVAAGGDLLAGVARVGALPRPRRYEQTGLRPRS